MRPTDETRKVKDMSTNERLLKLATADAATLARVDAVLDHRDTNERVREMVDARLLTYTETARMMKLSRPTIYRMVKAGRLKTMPLNGTSRIIYQSIVDCLNGGVR